MTGACECGRFTFETKRPPTFRFLCHCLLCQDFTGKPYSDMTVMRGGHVTPRNLDHIDFKKHRPPPNVNRGRCKSCGKPAIERMGAGPLQLVFLPSATYAEPDRLPAPLLHLFYHRRVRDVSDTLPKYEGYWSSQLAFMQRLLTKL